MYGKYLPKGWRRPQSANPTHRVTSSEYLPERWERLHSAIPTHRITFNDTYQRPCRGIRRAPTQTCERCVKLCRDMDDLEQENKQLKTDVERTLKDKETEIWSQISSTLDELYKENRRLKEKLAIEERNKMWGNRNEDYDQVEIVRNRYYKSLDENAHLEELLGQMEREVRNLKKVIVDEEAKLRRTEWQREDTAREMQRRMNMLELNYNHSLQIKDRELHFLKRRYLDLIQENEQLKEINKGSLYSSVYETQRVNALYSVLEEVEDENEELKKKLKHIEKERGQLLKETQRLTALNSNRRKAEAENEQLKQNLEHIKKENEELLKEKKRVSALYSNLRKLEAENEQLKQNLERIKKENEQLLRQSNPENKLPSIWAKRENEELKKQINDLVNEKESLRKSITDIKQQRSTENGQYQGVLAERERLKRNEISAETEMKKLRENVIGKDIEIMQLRRKLEQKNEKDSANLFKEKGELLKRGLAVDYELKTVQTELQKKQAVIQQLQEKNKETEKEVVELTNAIQMEIEEKENFKKSNKQLQDDLHQLRDKIKDLERGRIKFTQESNRSTDTEKEIDQLRLKVRDMEHEMARREWNKSNDTVKELDQLRSKVQDMEKEKAGLTRQLNRSNDSERELSELRVKLKNMEEEKRSLALQLRKSYETEKELHQLRTSAENMKDENARLARQLNKLYGTEEEREELRAKVNKMEDARLLVDRQFNILSKDKEKELNQLRAKITEMEVEKEKLTGQLNRSNDSERELSELRIKVKNMNEEKGNLAQRLKKSNDTEKELSQLQAKVKDMEDENGRLKRQLTKSKDYNEELNTNTSEIKDLKERNKKLTAENRQLQHAHATASKERDDLASSAEEKLKEFMKEIGDKNDDIHRLQTELRQMDRLQEKISQLSNENSNLRKENVDVSRQKEDALERLSRLAGAKLTHGNAAITDLSDTDRPTKIAEKFSELYDNAWTDAFEELDTTYHNETETINVLLKILQEAYTFCVQTEKDYEDRIIRAVFTLADEREITSADVAVQKALADLRISLGNPCCSVIEEMFLSRLPSILKEVDVAVCPKTKVYARQCASLCWRMRIREPPIFVRFEFRKGTTFNSDVLRKFTKTGGYLEFLVWPALYLHENGPLLAKGVAQPKLTP